MRNKRSVTFTQEYIKECFDYEPDTGKLIWKKRPLHHFPSYRSCRTFEGSHAGNEAGHVVGNRERGYYRKIFMISTAYLAHRLIWLWMTGRYPLLDIDHINGDGTDNRWVNLRETRHNARNRRKCSNNTSGYMGVTYRKDSGLYRAILSVDNPDGTTRRITIGHFVTAEEANEALVAYRLKNNYTARHGT